ncbi:hypothetical protein H6F32_05660 [Anabaena sp. FACHB-1237]|uniref:hypothetical protein n=1 Tax=Anabaena sp. FACHB-1237 TaxID=2692769 RepID=UPI001680FDD0|nr:hypothetical protein [Anabaena sp. FACHB-1237]MBD2137081.1 hypothetical protein [Anabaena sp. FACHB-1237]
MISYLHCPRHCLSQTIHHQNTAELGLCDFCWSEYSFCWSEYCLSQWYETQIKQDSQSTANNGKRKFPKKLIIVEHP